MTGVGAGVKEIRVRDEAGVFRIIYLATRPEGVYVLHCFPEEVPKDEPFGFGSSDETI
jgi:phage-related protein